MLTIQEKNHIKDILGDGLGINRNINLAYFLNQISESGKNMEELKSRIQRIEYNQAVIDRKLDMIIRLIQG